MDCLLPPLTTIPPGIRKCPLRTPPAPLSAVHCDTSAFPLSPNKHHLGGKNAPSFASTIFYS